MTLNSLVSRIKTNTSVKLMIERADKYLDAVGYTEHGERHASIVSKRSREVLVTLGFSEDCCNIAAVAGYMHDLGNMISRINHGQTGALLAHDVLGKMDVPLEDIIMVMTAIGNHEEETGFPMDPVSAALVIADKSDVHRSRVRNKNLAAFDIHDRVNYAVTHSIIDVDPDSKDIKLVLSIDTSISQVMEYFEIFLSRMLISKKAAAVLSCDFQLIINDVRL